MKIFISYTSSDKEWAHWIAWKLRETGHEPFVHEWEIGAGQNIPRWMDERLAEAHCLLGVFSDAYCKALYSQSERWAAFWNDPGGRSGFLVPVEVQTVSDWPQFVKPLRRLSLVGLEEPEAIRCLLAFLEKPTAPSVKPAFPGGAQTVPSSQKFAEGGDALGGVAPQFPPAQLPVPPFSKEPASASPQTAPDATIRCINEHEPKPQIFGREDEIETIVGAVLAGKPALVAGGPGMGKTAVATAALYDSRVAVAFGRRRVFASLEAATEPRAILTKLVEQLGLPIIGDDTALFRILETAVAGQPLAAILDNAETVFEADRAEAERLIKLVAALNGLSLVVTIRGVPPNIPNAVPIDDLPKLVPAVAQQAFLAIGGEIFAPDPDLRRLLEALDGHALSIQLVAAQAAGSPSLAGLRESWDEAHAQILRRPGEKESRLTSVRASLLLSLNSTRMKATPLARRLLSLLAYLPGGLDETAASSMLGDRGIVSKAKAHEIVGCLHQLRLIERRPDRRLRMLTPLRECVKLDLFVMDSDRRRLVAHYLSLADKANAIGTKQWQKLRFEVEAEADNLDAVCELAIEANINDKRLDDALSGLGELQCFSGRGTYRSIYVAARRLRSRPASTLAATCTYALGKIAHIRCRNETARIRFEEALRFYRVAKNVEGAANCIRRLGDIALGRSNYEMAQTLYEEALSVYQDRENSFGEANSIHSLGVIASVRYDHETAGMHYQRALAIYRKVGDVTGEANCLIKMGEIARLRDDYEAAKVYYDEALESCQRVGAVESEATCIRSFGDIARERSHHEGAQIHYQDAVMLFRRLGNVLGEAETIIKLGRVRRASGDNTQATNDINIGFALYYGVSDPEDRALPGWQAMHRALTCDNTAEAAKHRETARSAWTAIGRLDLVREWVDSP